MVSAQKTIYVIAALVLLSVPNTVGYETSNYNSNVLTSQMENGLWINGTISINGSTTLDPTLVDFNCPSLNKRIVGIPLIPYLGGVFGS